ncbi:MAG TPA: DUF4055 domain-containing protein [Hyphomonas sp.]|nr:DUF4055 domain-containing protein [Hyphomonas sp.]
MTIATATPATPCTEYIALKPGVQKVRDFISGGTYIRPYVKRLRGHSDEDYALFQSLAYYLPAVARTLDAYAGMVMTPEPVVSDAPTSLQPFLDDLTNEGEPFQRVTFRTVEEVCATGRYCILVDYPTVEGAAEKSRLDAEREGLRPFARCYKWEDVLDWRTTVRNGRRVLSHLRLQEWVDVPGDTEWVTKQRRQVRVLDLNEGRYRVRVFREEQKLDKGPSGAMPDQTPAMVQVGDDIFPTMNTKAMDMIPAIIFGPNSLDPNIIEKPPLLEMCEIAESHLNDSAHRQWALMWCGNPQPWIAGLMADEEGDAPIKWGSSTAIILGAEGSMGLVTMPGEGIGAIKDSMEEKRRDMAATGARILADESGAQISTETARIQRAGEHSVLAGIANTVADGMTQVLRIMAEWAGISGADKVAVTLNTDFLPRGLQPGELAEWLAGLQNGSIPLSVVIEHLKSRGVIDPQMTEQDWVDGIDESMMPPPPPPPPANDQNGNNQQQQGTA